jgi:hypothetical protein
MDVLIEGLDRIENDWEAPQMRHNLSSSPWKNGETGSICTTCQTSTTGWDLLVTVISHVTYAGGGFREYSLRDDAWESEMPKEGRRPRAGLLKGAKHVTH